MVRFLEKWYVLFMLMRIAWHNEMRMAFEEKYKEFFGDYGQDMEYIVFEECYEKQNVLYKRHKDGSEYEVASKPQKDDLGLYEYVEQRCGYCEDDFYGTIWTKTPFKNWWLERSFHC